MSDGWSLTGYQVLADSGWPSAIAPSGVAWKPPSPSSAFGSGCGTPPYVTSTVSRFPDGSPRGGVTISSAPSWRCFAASPSTRTRSTSSPARSSWNRDSARVVVTVSVAVPASLSPAGS